MHKFVLEERYRLWESLDAFVNRWWGENWIMGYLTRECGMEMVRMGDEMIHIYLSIYLSILL